MKLRLAEPPRPGYVSVMSILIIAALKSELSTLLNSWDIDHQSVVEKHAVLYHCTNGVHLLRTGVGLAKATRVLKNLPEFQPEKILHIGVSGALTERYGIGEMVRGVEFHHENGNTLRPELWLPSDRFSAQPTAPFLSVQKAVKSAYDRQRLHHQTGAELVDMESFAVANYCVTNQIPLLALRIVSDRADDFAMLTFVREFRTQAKKLQEFVLENRDQLNDE